MLARNEERLKALEGEIEDAVPFICDVSNEDVVNETVAQIVAQMGPPSVLIHNAVRGYRGTFLEVEPIQLEKNFRVNVMGLMYMARAVAPHMIEAGKGAIICTGNTASLRGKDFFSAFAPTKAAQRILAQSMARDLGPKGVHVAFIVIDAVIDLEWTRQAFDGAKDDFFIKPSAIADEAFHVAHQDKSAWSFDIELRPFGENW
jgi:NAD(P)-dependent dehydrogenase (short-subunit alcohol dehydrogenase family)